MKINFLILLAILSIVILSCDDGIKFDNPNDEKNKVAVQQGELGGECYPNNTCDEGLTCDKENNTCIEEPQNTNDDEGTDTMSEYNEDKTDSVSEYDEDEPLSDDSDSIDTTHDDADSIDDSGDFVPDENNSDDDSANSVSDDDSDSTDTKPDSSDSTPDEDVVDETPDEVAVLECPNNCSGHGECDTITGVCSCTDNHDGAECSECKTGYTNNSGTCIKSCDTNKCFKTHSCTGDYQTYALEGHGTCSNTTGECICDAGWLTGTSNLGTGTSVTCGLAIAPVETLNNVECAICDKNNPPSNYSSTGCPLSATGSSTYCFCDTGILFSTGTCYYEPTGDHKLYCVCNSGYHLDGDKYTGSCVEDE